MNKKVNIRGRLVEIENPMSEELIEATLKGQAKIEAKKADPNFFPRLKGHYWNT